MKGKPWQLKGSPFQGPRGADGGYTKGRGFRSGCRGSSQGVALLSGLSANCRFVLASLLPLLKRNVITFYLFRGGGVYHEAHVEVREQLWESVLSFYI